MQRNILEYLEATAPRLPSKIAYSNGKEHISFSELYRGARVLGTNLCKRGYRAEPIAILMEKHPRVPIAFFGSVYAGCYYVPLDPTMPPKRMEGILEQVGARLLIVDEKGARIARELSFAGECLPYADLVEGEIDEDALTAVREQQLDIDPIYIVFTSGSTGTPKGVVACHRSVIDYVEALSDTLGFGEDSVFANQTPLFFDAPLKELMPVIKFGATAYFVPKMLFSFPTKLCDYLNEHRINTVCWVVTALTMISSTGTLQSNPPRYLKTVAFGSEVFPPAQYKLWREALPNAAFFNLYGPTEATGMSCYWRADRELDEGEPIPIGRPFPNTGVLLLGEDGQPVPSGEAGEICLRGTCVTLGYYNDPTRTEEVFVQNPTHARYPERIYRTGDMGKYNERGELVFLTRRDSQIKHQGHRIELGEIEAAADAVGAARACCVYDRERRRILLYYVGAPDAGEMSAQLKAYLPRYMQPSACIQLDAMPLTPNGKMDRRGLSERARNEK